ncbi:MAG TPA: response regulator [Pyrinomonadaceae bacterium]|jgi:CheY-like chemotaxis protein|nr:response regulator [Pyrinomonadaceae bacterium]
MSTTPPTTQRILIADDDPIIRRVVTRLTESEGFQPVVVNDGGAAYRLLQTDANFCGAIFDMMMPQLAGLDVIRFMNTEKRLLRIPVMMITSEQDLRLMANSFAAGVTLFLPKPFTPEQFQTTFRLLIKGNQNRLKNLPQQQRS